LRVVKTWRAVPVVVAAAACGGSGNGPSTHDAAADVVHEAGTKVDGKTKKDAGQPHDGGAHDAAKEGGKLDAAVDAASPDGGPASLVALSVSVGGGADALVPKFSPGIHDYYVPCAAGTNHLTVAMTASGGASCSVTEPAPASPSAHMQTVDVTAPEGQLIDAVAANEAGSTDYWVRCLPHDFPGIKVTTTGDAGPGYYAIGNHVVPSGQSGYAIILDGNGVPLWYSASLGTNQAGDVESLQPGQISFIPVSFVAYNPFHVETISSSPPPTSITVAASDAGLGSTDAGLTLNYTSDEHDLRYQKSNGHYFTFSSNLVTGVDLTGMANPIHVDGSPATLGPNSTIQDCSVLEVDPNKTTGNVVWSWSAFAHFDPVKVTVHPATAQGQVGLTPEGDAVYDVFHCTSIDIDPANGNLLIASRQMSSVFYVEYPSGRVLWKMGGPDGGKDTPPPVYVHLPNPADAFDEEHDARLLGWSATCNGGTGQVSMLDDESTTTQPPRGIIYDVVVGGGDAGCVGSFDGGGPASGTARSAWQFVNHGGASGGGGNLRISPDNTRVLGWGVGSPVITEVDVSGKTLRVVEFTTGDVSYRGLKVPTSQFDIAALRANAGM